MNRAEAIHQLTIEQDDSPIAVATKENFNKLFEALNFFAQNGVKVKILRTAKGYKCTLSKALPSNRQS